LGGLSGGGLPWQAWGPEFKTKKCSFISYFMELFEEYWCQLFFKGLVEFSSEPICSWALLCWEIITSSISLLIIYLFKWFIFSSSIVEGHLHLDIYSFLLDFPVYCNKSFLKYSLIILWISLVFVLISCFLTLILLIWVFSLFLLVNLANDLSILFIFSKNSFFH
jgi:hypothetical protein